MHTSSKYALALYSVPNNMLCGWAVLSSLEQWRGEGWAWPGMCPAKAPCLYR